MTLQILYVEDNAQVRELTCALLATPSREITAFGTAEEAQQEFSQRHFDLVIADANLPGISGIELARELLRQKPDTAIIIASGYRLNAAVEKLGRNVRALVKPFDAAELEALIRGLVG
jgi:DNA-binding response OmpR family regulator